MKVLVVNAHADTQSGRSKFGEFQLKISRLLKDTIYYGSGQDEIVRSKDELDDLLYEQDTSYNKPANLERFRLYSLVIIDGECNIRPWNPLMKTVLVLIRMCLRQNTKLIACGFGCLSLYFTLATSSSPTLTLKPSDTSINPINGDITQQSHNLGNCGLHSNRHAIESHQFPVKYHNINVLLPTKMHFPCISTLAGSPLVKDVKFPFSLYCTSTWMCNPVEYLPWHVEVLVETECKLPVVFVRNQAIGGMTMCGEFQRILANWFVETSQGTVGKGHLKRSQTLDDDICLDNQRRQSIRSRPTTATISRTFTYVSHISRPASGVPKNHSSMSKVLALQVPPPCVRCSGPYETQEQMYKKRMRESSKKTVSKTYMRYGVEEGEFDIKNYVTRTFSRPVSNYQFRSVDKSKWLGKKPFFVA